MIKHNLLIKTKGGTTESDVGSLIRHAKDLELIPGVIEVYAGLNVSEEGAAAYNVCLRVRLASREALGACLGHVAHRNFADTYVHPIRDYVAVFDLELQV